MQPILFYRILLGVNPVFHAYMVCRLTLREKHRLRVFESSMLKRIFGPKRDEVT
jgi:hypothetical protein